LENTPEIDLGDGYRHLPITDVLRGSRGKSCVEFQNYETWCNFEYSDGSLLSLLSKSQINIGYNQILDNISMAVVNHWEASEFPSMIAEIWQCM